jgi:hypothetical protein
VELFIRQQMVWMFQSVIVLSFHAQQKRQTQLVERAILDLRLQELQRHLHRGSATFHAVVFSDALQQVMVIFSILRVLVHIHCGLLEHMKVVGARAVHAEVVSTSRVV